MVLDTLRNDLMSSLKKGDSNRVETLRFLLSAIRNVAIATYGSAGEASLTDPDIVDVIKKQVKTHKESIDAFTKAGRTELSERESNQLHVLEEFLPKEISDEELKYWFNGENLARKNLSGFVLIKNKNDFLGCGYAKEGIIINYIPKERRVKELI